MTTLISDRVSLTLDGNSILKDVSLTAAKGNFIGLIGPNGSGKSTWIRALAGLLSFQQGKIYLNGKEIKLCSPKEIALMIGYVPQDTSFHFDFSVHEIVLMGRHAHIPRFGLESQEDYDIVQDAMERTNISHLSNHSVNKLSGGQRQLVFIAKALAQQADILLLDEPTSALDINRQLQVLELTKQLTKEGVTVIMALHDLNLAARFCDKLVLLANGRVLAFGEPKDVFSPETLRESYQIHTAVRYDDLIEAYYITALSQIEEAVRI